MASQTAKVLFEVEDERRRQDDKWGEQNHPDGTKHTTTRLNAMNMAKKACESKPTTWRKILNEEIQEAFFEVEQDALRTELIQVAAVAVSWIEAIDRRNNVKPVESISGSTEADQTRGEGQQEPSL